MTKVLFLVHTPVKILKRDLTVFTDRIMNVVHAVIDAFVHRFDTVCDKDLPLKLRSLMRGTERFKLFDKLVAFSVCDKF